MYNVLCNMQHIHLLYQFLTLSWWTRCPSIPMHLSQLVLENEINGFQQFEQAPSRCTVLKACLFLKIIKVVPNIYFNFR